VTGHRDERTGNVVRGDNFAVAPDDYAWYVLQAFRGIWPGRREFEQQGDGECPRKNLRPELS
jgi:hypothetical protein